LFDAFPFLPDNMSSLKLYQFAKMCSCVFSETNQPPEDPSIKADQLEAVSGLLNGDWKKLATELGFPEDDIEYLASEGAEEKAHALKMLTLWKVRSDMTLFSLIRLAYH
jgi:hypothetical protein